MGPTACHRVSAAFLAVGLRISRVPMWSGPVRSAGCFSLAGRLLRRSASGTPTNAGAPQVPRAADRRRSRPSPAMRAPRRSRPHEPRPLPNRRTAVQLPGDGQNTPSTAWMRAVTCVCRLRPVRSVQRRRVVIRIGGTMRRCSTTAAAGPWCCRRTGHSCRTGARARSFPLPGSCRAGPRQAHAEPIPGAWPREAIGSKRTECTPGRADQR